MENVKTIIRRIIEIECKIMNDIAEESINLGINPSNKEWDSFRGFIEEQLSKSIYQTGDSIKMFWDWVEGNRFCNLPQHSSGSFYTALKDEDNMFCAFEPILEEINDENFTNEMYHLMIELLN
jgi:hypothetical protein